MLDVEIEFLSLLPFYSLFITKFCEFFNSTEIRKKIIENYSRYVSETNGLFRSIGYAFGRVFVGGPTGVKSS